MMFTSCEPTANPLPQDLLASILESVGDGVIVTDGEGRVIGMNRMAVQLTGVTLPMAQGQMLPQVLQLAHPQYNSLLTELMQRVFREGVSTGLPRDTQLVRPDGLDYLSATLAPLGGGHRGLVVTFREINRHRQLEDSLREQAQREHLVRQVASRIHRSTQYELKLSGNLQALQAALAQFPGLAGVQTQSEGDNHVVTVTTNGDTDIGPELTALVVQAGVRLYEMNRRRATLEDVFLQLTTSEDTAEDEAFANGTVADS